VPTRRTYLAGLAAASLTGLAGCSGVVGSGADVAGDDAAEQASTGTPPVDAPEVGTPPVADTSLHLGHTTTALREQIMDGGPGKDGIPSIDDPGLVGPDGTDLSDESPVFGVAFDDDVRAYPQSVLVWHEIVNDIVGDVPVSITYCPLTGTAMGFFRGETEFGVSGRLVNNNLVMYDRTTDSFWQQVAATSIDGTHEGASLREFRVVWTTWGAWRERHPESSVLSTDTGFARDYTRDPYGSYAPRSGYYQRSNGETLFPTLRSDDRLPAKAVVMGARTPDGAIAFEKATLREAGVATGNVGEIEVVAVHDPVLDTAYVYRTDGATVEAAGAGTARVDGERHPVGSLPLNSVYTFDAMWFAWVGFYPDTGLVR